MEELVKGTVTPLSSIFPAEEAHKASKRVQDTIDERRKELDQLRGFAADNTSLINLVQKLPDELHHDIMVPFGKAAFFPGRLIHTNEFLVHLGEGYYADRTSKQTIDILKRRGKALESQVESVKAVLQDLKAEASFFEATAAEAAEGLVEIREEYVDETSAENVSKAGPGGPDTYNFSEADNMKDVTEDEEYARIMSRIDELEKEEFAAVGVNECEKGEEYAHITSRIEELEKLAAASDNESEDEEYASVMTRTDDLVKMEHAAKSINEYNEYEYNKADFGSNRSLHPLDHKERVFEGHQLSNPPKQLKDERSENLPSKVPSQQLLFNQFKGLKMRSMSEDKASNDQSCAVDKSSEEASVLPVVMENAEPQSKYKAFTGSIVEHALNLEANPRDQTTASSKSTAPQTSKPVSRFRMQRR